MLCGFVKKKKRALCAFNLSALTRTQALPQIHIVRDGHIGSMLSLYINKRERETLIWCKELNRPSGFKAI